MGAWDIGSFDNDTACDWVYDLERSADTALIADALETVAAVGEGYLDSDECCEAIAATEIIAALRGHPLPNLTDETADWVERHRHLDTSGLIAPALAALQRIRSDSELKELWDEVEETAKWLATLDDLTSRLNAAAR
jgi:hypothetical protein